MAKHLDPQSHSKIVVRGCHLIIRRYILKRQQCLGCSKSLPGILRGITQTPSQTLLALTLSLTYWTAERNTFSITPPTHSVGSNQPRKYSLSSTKQNPDHAPRTYFLASTLPSTYSLCQNPSHKHFRCNTIRNLRKHAPRSCFINKQQGKIDKSTTKQKLIATVLAHGKRNKTIYRQGCTSMRQGHKK
jgi:hypothetical protein